MEKTPYFNKAVKAAEQEMKRVEALRSAFDSSIGEIKKVISQNGGDPNIITELQRAAKAGNLQKIQELKNKLK